MKYENLFIGDFIYSLGYAAGTLGIKDDKIHLFQQTPQDATAGDMIARIGGVNFLMEFKRNKKLLASEYKKAKDFLLVQKIEDGLIEISKKSHFIAFGEESKLLVQAYISLNPLYEQTLAPIDQNIFYERIIKKEIGASSEELKTYVEFLIENNKGSTSSGILVNILQGRKPLVIDMSQGFDLNIKIEIEPEIALKPTIQKSKDIGFNL